MMAVKSLVSLVTLLWGALNVQMSDVKVSCRYTSSTIIPCVFQTGGDLVVHWMKEQIKEELVHSYYDAKDQLEYQLKLFRGRTSLFHEELSRGNASLLLQKVQISDRGRYSCYTSNSKGQHTSYINLEVEAPVTKVSISLEGDRVICSSEGIYPRPQVTWSWNKNNDTEMKVTEQELYNISSSVQTPGDEADVKCTVSNLYSSRSATLSTTGLSVTSTEETFHCPALKSPLTSVTWSFNGSLLVQRQERLTVTEWKWKDHVKSLSLTGSLTLQSLSSNLSGLYTCEVINQEETLVKIIRVQMALNNAATWVLPTVLVLLIIGIIGGLIFYCVRKKKEGNYTKASSTQVSAGVEMNSLPEEQPLTNGETPNNSHGREHGDREHSENEERPSDDAQCVRLL